MNDFEFLTGDVLVSSDQLAHDLALARLIKSGDVPPSASGYSYFGAYTKYLREFEVVIESRMSAQEEFENGDL